ncbi:hypothetical protein GWI34_32425 [Actinomadura sp. DSM 109109]|nr:hypothetical protein [Actinomadura lepetitiana]
MHGEERINFCRVRTADGNWNILTTIEKDLEARTRPAQDLCAAGSLARKLKMLIKISY